LKSSACTFIINQIQSQTAHAARGKMHELPITQSILDIALNEAGAAQSAKIITIYLVVGELSGVSSECVQFYFDVLKKGNAAEEATLDFRHVPAEFKCRDCQTVFTLQESYWLCPNCQGINVEVLAGKECYIESLEVE
jgi:hydrogenase nickel incorporation protein HypA/HybF